MTETGTRRYTWRGIRGYTSGQGMLVQMDARPGRTQAHMFLGDAGGSIAARVVGKQGGRGGTYTWGEVEPRISGNRREAMDPERRL